jgi:hypothetical protein
MPEANGYRHFVLGSANQGQAWVACYFDIRTNRGAELNETGKTADEAAARCGWRSIGMGRNTCDELTRLTMYRKAALAWFPILKLFNVTVSIT